MSFGDAYGDGKVSHFAKRIYDVVEAAGALPVHDIKTAAGFGKDDKAAFDKALTELQMGLHLTMCGKAYKSAGIAQNNNAWASTVFCMVESFFDEATIAKAAKITRDEAHEKIRAQVLKLNPNAADRKISKFIFG